MSSFFVKDNQIVNLQNVSTIKIHREKNRIIFNLNYSIQVERNGSERLRADYVYWDFDDPETLDTVFEKITKAKFVKENFLNLDEGGLLVNKASISSVKFERNSNRLIFNLNNLRDFSNPKAGIHTTSDFFFVDYVTESQAEEMYNSIINILVK